MAKLGTQFETFLSSIEPDERAVRYAQKAHTTVREGLEKDDKFREYVEGSFLYGSYKRHTAVGSIKDVDIVVLTNFDVDDEANTPRNVLRKLKEALARCYEDPENPEYQRRSIRINDPIPDADIEMTLDIIPAVVVTSAEEPLLVPDTVVKQWIRSHPKGHLKHSTELNSCDSSQGRFVPLVKMMKWWWATQCETRQPDVERPKPKGFWIECLVGENLDVTQHDWADHFIAVLQNISEKYTGATEVPELQDPGLDGATVRTSMTLQEFEIFMDAINESLESAILARDASDELKSSELWRELFGELFPLYDSDEAAETRAAARAMVLGDCAHAKPLRWPAKTGTQCRVQLDAYLYRDPNGRKSGGLNSNGRQLPNGWWIKFKARARVHGEYQVFWQVVNTGKHAESRNGLRGDFFEARRPDGSASADPSLNWEHTEYTGKHWIECFIVKDGVCVGRSPRFYVNIKNPVSDAI